MNTQPFFAELRPWAHALTLLPGLLFGLLFGLLLGLPLPAWAQSAESDAAAYVNFSQDFVGTCVSRNGVQILVRNGHPTRKLRVWLDRFHMGVGTGDRSRSDLAAGAEPEPLGCSRSESGPQEWRLVRAVFVD